HQEARGRWHQARSALHQESQRQRTGVHHGSVGHLYRAERTAQRRLSAITPMPTLLARHAEVLVTMDGQRRELKNAGLYAEDGIIKTVGPTESLPATADM